MIGCANSGDIRACENNQKGFAQTVRALAGTLQLESLSVDIVLLRGCRTHLLDLFLPLKFVTYASTGT